MRLALPARAKLNLDLEVFGRRKDGYHDIRTTFQEIDLHDLLEFEPARESTFTFEGFNVDGRENSVLAAQRALELAAGRPLPTRIHLHKRIPPGSGLGGASSDAATTLKALTAMHALEVDLAVIARELGADVPFFLIGGRAHGEGRGERLTPTPSAGEWFAIAWPGIELKTADVYRAWDDVQGRPPNHLQRAAEHVEPRVEAFARRLGPAWQMTGSGSAFFKVAETDQDARNAIAGLDCWTAVTR